jgi:WD40 repeat protein
LDTETGREIRRLVGHREVVTDVAFSPDGKLILSSSTDSSVILWDATSGAEIDVDATQDDLLAWVVANRYVPELTCEQRQRYHVEPLCDEAGAEPRSGELSSVVSSPPR